MKWNLERKGFTLWNKLWIRAVIWDERSRKSKRERVCKLIHISHKPRQLMCTSSEFLPLLREMERERVWGAIRAERERRGGWEWASQRERERERECFSLPLATVGGVRLQPVVFSRSPTHTDTDSHSYAPSTRSPVSLLDPGVSFNVFFFFFLTNGPFCFSPRDESCFSRIRKRREATRKAAIEKDGRKKQSSGDSER